MVEKELVENRRYAIKEIKRYVLVAKDGARIDGPSDAARIIGGYFEQHLDMSVENFVVACLDSRGRVTCVEHVAKGTLTACLVHPREVFCAAVAKRAASIVVMHNHPSGDPAPSDEDEDLTHRLVESGKLLGIPVMDHVVIADGKFRSVIHTGQRSVEDE